MAPIGRLRLRGEQLVVEGMGGQILAQVEPDEHMRVEVVSGLISSILGEHGNPQPVTVTWLQVLDEGRGYIDVSAVDVLPRRAAGLPEAREQEKESI